MIILFEMDRRGGFRLQPKIERCGPMARLIWGWWSVAYFHQCGINDVGRAFRADERQRLVDSGRLENDLPAD
jgi:hypothetical protein